MDKKILRLRPNNGDGRSAVYVEEMGCHVVPEEGVGYAEDDPIVRAHPWLFVSDEDTDTTRKGPPESVRIESATRAPGEQRRSTRRP